MHFSDWHGEFRKLPPADVYVCTGDMLPNDPVPLACAPSETDYQNRWFTKRFAAHRDPKKRSLRRYFGCPDAPVVVVRGNHEFIDLGQVFGGEYYEIGDGTGSREFCGLRFGGFRGITYFGGGWSDELREHQLDECCARLEPDLDVVVTHTPPLGILDSAHGQKIGANALMTWINRKLYEGDEKLPRLFCFGHCHQDGGRTIERGGMLFSNAATTINQVRL